MSASEYEKRYRENFSTYLKETDEKFETPLAILENIMRAMGKERADGQFRCQSLSGEMKLGRVTFIFYEELRNRLLFSLLALDFSDFNSRFSDIINNRYSRTCQLVISSSLKKKNVD